MWSLLPLRSLRSLEQEVTPPAEDKSMLYIAAGIGATCLCCFAGAWWLAVKCVRKEKAAQEDELWD